ncbi:MAG: protein phosphatase 2C domain-containing protein [Acidobacteria bacterium]|nr:protein phosphatase 2C domain-containing protein [Acidobacteriota bacterium]MXZ37499.1 serine/threonine-protein phosphatase [Holophagales bacterium]MYJ25525.1 serine/threonine-protein phosphatase [Holophagales bacterium]
MIEGRHFAAATMIGARKRQEDGWSVQLVAGDGTGEELLLAAVADGMGGLPAGDQASRITIRSFVGSYPLITKPPPERLRPALNHANQAMREAIEADPSLRGMGSTLVATLFFEDRFQWLSVGDSHIFHWRGGALERVNPLHTYGRELDARAGRGEISAMHAALHPERAAITSAVMGLPLEEVAEGQVDLADGDVVVLASDGIETLSDEETAAICGGHRSAGASRIAAAIIRRIEQRATPWQDNATVVVVCPSQRSPANQGGGAAAGVD